MAVIITVPEELRRSLGEGGASGFVDVLHQFGEATKQDVIQASRDSFEKTLTQTELRIEEKLGAIKGEIGSVRAEISQLELRIEEKLGAIKGEIGSVRAEMGQMEGRLESKIAGVEGRLESKIAGVEGRLESKIAQSQSTLIKWLFSLTMAQTTAVIIAILLK